MIKAIETRYKGYRFRSRLEARWAVFFDALGIKWEYEKEGYKLKSGCYLPDFWLPQVEMWAEVKPVAFDRLEIMLCEQLARETSKSCLMLVGVPNSVAYPAIKGAEFEHGGWTAKLTYYDLAHTNGYHLNESRFYWVDFDCIDFGCDFEKPTPAAPDKLWKGLVFDYQRPSVEEVNLHALSAARSARFEHGERGAG